MTTRSRQSTLLKIAGAGVAAAALVGAGLHLSTGADSQAATVDLAASNTTAVTALCPDVASKVLAVPAHSQAGVSTELANLVRQIDNVNARLAREPDQATSQLGDIQGKRNAVIDRIILDITRVGGAEPVGLRGLAACALSPAAAGGGGAATPATVVPVVVAPTLAPTAGKADRAHTVNCPAVQSALPAVPAGAQAEVDRNLALLNQQIAEANARLARIFVRPEGGPAFIQNAILGPLEDKRFATLNRIATAIERITKDRPAQLQNLATCTLR